MLLLGCLRQSYAKPHLLFLMFGFLWTAIKSPPQSLLLFMSIFLLIRWFIQVTNIIMAVESQSLVFDSILYEMLNLNRYNWETSNFNTGLIRLSHLICLMSYWQICLVHLGCEQQQLGFLHLGCEHLGWPQQHQDQPHSPHHCLARSSLYFLLRVHSHW